MSTSSWSTVVQVRIVDGSAPARDTVKTAITRTFETLETLETPDAAEAAGPAPADRSFSVETAGRRFPTGAAPLAPSGSGPATITILGDVDAVDRVAAVLSAAFATDRVAEDRTTLTLRIHPDRHALGSGAQPARHHPANIDAGAQGHGTGGHGTVRGGPQGRR
ncbi:hypothetical protein G5C60_03575 [Streptomyces sp. HC44]|uniref:Uncharacterized protein n=1 Tax=Streptomyces scabichelini TaxID=2711217 RepID=A0A6G4UYG3_9ACTN|nr:hypothetical protein [Streptomyces scabichelini]NGO06766.1 hypothetical protein [Streptomyces scabichelini]